MKKILFIFSYLVMITCALLINQACQENYEMVDPPLITGTDDLDEEVIMPEDLECYYVSPTGKGSLDGSSWDNAMSADYFRNLLSANSVIFNQFIFACSQIDVFSIQSFCIFNCNICVAVCT